MYDPKIGQFLSEDPIGFDAADLNLRRYVSNLPTMLTDPSGLEPPATAPTTPFPPPKTDANFKAYAGQKAIIDYLKITVEYKRGTISKAECSKNTLVIGNDQSDAKKLGHIYHELISILSNRILGYAESSTLRGSDKTPLSYGMKFAPSSICMDSSLRRMDHGESTNAGGVL